MKPTSIAFRRSIDVTSKVVLLVAALISVLTVVLITIFISIHGVPVFFEVKPSDFFFSTNWNPSSSQSPQYGILSFLLASFEVTILAMFLALPIALCSALFLSECAKGFLGVFLQRSIELLSGIPSIIVGLFGIAVIVPLSRKFFGGSGYSLLSASIILAIMILPTIITFSQVAISSVPQTLKAASFAMGATQWQTMYRVILPSAKKGIVSSIILAIGRAIGETTAVALVGGNAPIFTVNPLSMGRTLTMNIITDMSYAEGTHMNALFATALLLFWVIILLNGIVVKITKRSTLHE